MNLNYSFHIFQFSQSVLFYVQTIVCNVIAENWKQLYNAVNIVGHMFFKWDEMSQSTAFTVKKRLLVFLKYVFQVVIN